MALGNLRQLKEEEPQLHVLWQRENRNPYAGHGTGRWNPQKYLWERFGLEVEFDEESIVYSENSGGAGGRHRAF